MELTLAEFFSKYAPRMNAALLHRAARRMAKYDPEEIAELLGEHFMGCHIEDQLLINMKRSAMGLPDGSTPRDIIYHMRINYVFDLWSLIYFKPSIKVGEVIVTKKYIDGQVVDIHHVQILSFGEGLRDLDGDKSEYGRLIAYQLDQPIYKVDMINVFHQMMEKLDSTMDGMGIF